METFDCQNLIGELKTRDKISRRYQSRENANRHQYFESRATRLPSSTDFPVLIAFRHVDEIIKEERNHQRELEDSLAEVKMNNEIISAISKIYYMGKLRSESIIRRKISGG